jgi:hypothetical protein
MLSGKSNVASNRLQRRRRIQAAAVKPPVVTSKKPRLDLVQDVVMDDLPPVDMLMQDVFKPVGNVGGNIASPVRNVPKTPSAASFILQAIRPGATPVV